LRVDRVTPVGLRSIFALGLFGQRIATRRLRGRPRSRPTIGASFSPATGTSAPSASGSVHGAFGRRLFAFALRSFEDVFDVHGVAGLIDQLNRSASTPHGSSSLHLVGQLDTTRVLVVDLLLDLDAPAP